MSSHIESKGECRIHIVAETQFTGLSFQGTIHLFEHRYDANFFFWHGVIEVASSYVEMYNFAMKNLGQEIRVDVILSDGRHGSGRITQQYETSLDWSTSLLVEVAGLTPLEAGFLPLGL